MVNKFFNQLKLFVKENDDLVDLTWVNPRIRLDIRYATDNNFTGCKLYEVPKCFLRKNVAHKLSAVQKKLEAKGLGLKVYDGYRPLSIQKKFWELVPDEKYVANPAQGSRHNRGAAVDLTLVDSEGNELPMPTPFDEFSPRAHRDYKDLPLIVIENRSLLENAMVDQGFVPFPTEWWHFDDINWKQYPIEDIPLEGI